MKSVCCYHIIWIIRAEVSLPKTHSLPSLSPKQRLSHPLRIWAALLWTHPNRPTSFLCCAPSPSCSAPGGLKQRTREPQSPPWAAAPRSFAAAQPKGGFLGRQHRLLTRAQLLLHPHPGAPAQLLPTRATDLVIIKPLEQSEHFQLSSNLSKELCYK